MLFIICTFPYLFSESVLPRFFDYWCFEGPIFDPDFGPTFSFGNFCFRLPFLFAFFVSICVDSNLLSSSCKILFLY